jgi:hypothetical protein
MPKLASEGVSKNFTGGHVSSVLLQSAASFLQRNFCLEVGLEIASQYLLDLARKAQSSQESSRTQPGVQGEPLESFAFEDQGRRIGLAGLQ